MQANSWPWPVPVPGSFEKAIRTCALLIVVSLCVKQPANAQSTRCAIDSLARWAVVNRTWSRETGTTWSNDSLRRVLLALQQQDQKDRGDFGSRITDSTYARRLMELDQQTSAVVKNILDQFGLPTRSMVGAAGASAVFLVVQHSATLQDRVLDLAKRAAPGEVPPSSLAMLEDRVFANAGKLQNYGTHFTLGSDGLFRLAPVADPAGMTLRRERAGLPPLDTYVCLLEESGMRVDRKTLPP
jgi:hypothetical protein